jgi:hypothetical protein
MAAFAKNWRRDEDARNAPLNKFHSNLISLRQISVSRTCLDTGRSPPALRRETREFLRPRLEPRQGRSGGVLV